MIPLWYLIAGMAVAYGLGIWVGWAARRYYHQRVLSQVRRAIAWNG